MNNKTSVTSMVRSRREPSKKEKWSRSALHPLPLEGLRFFRTVPERKTCFVAAADDLIRLFCVRANSSVTLMCSQDSVRSLVLAILRYCNGLRRFSNALVNLRKGPVSSVQRYSTWADLNRNAFLCHVFAQSDKPIRGRL